MGMFDTINSNTGQAGLIQQAKWFATLDLNSMFKEGQKALLDWLVNAVEFFHYLFVKPGTQEMILGERLIDQIPGMAVALSKGGYLDSTIGDYAQSHLDVVNIVDRHYGHYDPIVKIAQTLFTVLFGVRILHAYYLDYLENGMYRTLPYTSDITDEALQRAEFLKKNFFQNSTYNTKRWDMNKFQEYPLKSPIPSLSFGELFTGAVPGGGQVANGILVSGGAVVPVEVGGTTNTTTQSGLNWGLGLLILGAAIAIGSSD